MEKQLSRIISDITYCRGQLIGHTRTYGTTTYHPRFPSQLDRFSIRILCKKVFEKGFEIVV